VKPLCALALAGALISSAAEASPADASAEALARRIEQRHRTLADFTARFVQSYRSGILGREVTERGTVSVKPPGRMLWEYRDPEPKTFVSDGKAFYFYVPADRQVVVRERGGDRGLLARLLAGGASLLAEFDAGLEQGAAGRPRLRLTPKQPDPDVERVCLEADARDRIQSLEILDTQGNRSRFRFEAIRENVGLSDRLFRFTVPEGVELVSG
jgi:outer membrane lipoprotein carrier protein